MDDKHGRSGESSAGRSVDPRLRAQLANELRASSAIQQELRQIDPAITTLTRAVEIGSDLLTERPGNSDYMTDLAISLESLGRLHLGNLSWARARLDLERARQLREGLLEADSKSTQKAASLAARELELGRLYSYLGLWHEAAIHDRQGLKCPGTDDLVARSHLAWYALAAGDRPGYQALLREIDRGFGQTGSAPILLQAHMFDTQPPASAETWVRRSREAFRNPRADFWVFRGHRLLSPARGRAPGGHRGFESLHQLPSRGRDPRTSHSKGWARSGLSRPGAAREGPGRIGPSRG